jgi:magnesium transporter
LERQQGTTAEIAAAGTWIDLVQPTHEEERQLEAALGHEIPTREEMQEIEASSRLYEEGGALYMTALVISKADTDAPMNSPVTFILTPRHLITVRYADPLPFRTFIARVTKQPRLVATPDTAIVVLLEAIVDRAADLLERVGGELDAISGDLFRRANTHSISGKSARSGGAAASDLDEVLRRIGQSNDLATKVREGLLSLARLLAFFTEGAKPWVQKEMRGHLKTLGRDIRSLNEHDTYLQQKVNFLLDTTLGLVNIQQNAIIKIFSVMAVVFMPPTMIASIYGMNFRYMPELDFAFGYPLALLVMAAAAILPYFYFKFRRWL